MYHLLFFLLLYSLYLVAPDDEFLVFLMFVQDYADLAKGAANRADGLPRIMEALASGQVVDTTSERENESV